MRKRSPLLLIGGVLFPTGAIVLAAIWWLQRPTFTADVVAVAQAQLAVLDDPRAITLIRESAVRDRDGLGWLVAGLLSGRPALVSQAKLGLFKQLDHWTLEAEGEAAESRLALAESLARHASELSPQALRTAIDVVTRLLSEPCEDATISAKLLAACEQVLQQSVGLRDTPQIATSTGIAEPTPVEAALTLPKSDWPQLRLPDELRLPPLPTIPARSPSSIEETAPNKSPTRVDPSQPTTESPRLQRVPDDRRLQAKRSPHVERQAIADLTIVELLQLWHESPVGHRKTVEHELHDRGVSARQIEVGVGLTSPEISERLHWIEQLPRLSEVDAKPWLLWLSKDASDEVRLAALRLMATSAEPEFLRRAAALNSGDRNSEIRELAGKMLRGVDAGVVRR